MLSDFAARAFVVACALGLGVGCALDEGDAPADDGVGDGGGKSDGWRGIKTIAFNDVALAPTDGRSELLTLNVPAGTQSFTINIFGDDLQDEFVVDHLEGPNGERLVSDQPEGLTEEQTDSFAFGAGQFFSPNRAVAQAGFASLLVPNAPGISIAPGAWKLRVRGVRVDAQDRVHASRVRPDVKVVIKSGPENRRKLKVSFHLSGSYGLTAASASSDAGFQQAVRELTELYASAGIDVIVASTQDVDAGLQQLNETDLLTPVIRAGDVDGLNIVVIGEFRWDPRMEGYAAGMPGPVFLSAVPHNAVFISNRPPVPNVPSTPMGLVMAHEVGHYLGLPHTFDELGLVALDPFDDTSDQALSGNLMEPGGIDLSRTTTPIHLSPQQIELLLRSPAVR